MPRVKLFDEKEALTKAMNLFWEKGYDATSLADLLSVLGIGKGSFYDTFHSKKKLFDRALSMYLEERKIGFSKILASEKNVQKGVSKFMHLRLEELLSDEKHRGCFATNTYSELTSLDHLVEEELTQFQLFLHTILTEYINQSKHKFKMDTNSFVNLLMTFTLGMNQQTKLNYDRLNYTTSINNIVKLL